MELGDELQMRRDQEKDLDFQAGLASFVSSNTVPPALHRKGKIECKKRKREYKGRILFKRVNFVQKGQK